MPYAAFVISAEISSGPRDFPFFCLKTALRTSYSVISHSRSIFSVVVFFCFFFFENLDCLHLYPDLKVYGSVHINRSS